MFGEKVIGRKAGVPSVPDFLLMTDGLSVRGAPATLLIFGSESKIAKTLVSC